MKKDPKREETPRVHAILPKLWLQGMQGLISRMLDRRIHHSSRGVHRSDYFQGIHTEHQFKALQKRRAKNKVARRSRRINRLRAKR